MVLSRHRLYTIYPGILYNGSCCESSALVIRRHRKDLQNASRIVILQGLTQGNDFPKVDTRNPIEFDETIERKTAIYHSRSC